MIMRCSFIDPMIPSTYDRTTRKFEYLLFIFYYYFSPISQTQNENIFYYCMPFSCRESNQDLFSYA